ncbi:single-stranded DNA-binding protein [Vibrio lentus]
MSNALFVFEGNIGQTPELLWQPGNEKSNGQSRPLLKFTAKYDRLVKTNNQEQPYEDKGGFWVNIDYWRNNAEEWAKLLQKGMRVRIEGQLRMDTWPDKNNPGQTQSGMALTASSISILPSRLESVVMKSRQSSRPSDASSPGYSQQSTHNSEHYGSEAFGGDDQYDEWGQS